MKEEEMGEEGEGEVTSEERVEVERAIVEEKSSWVGLEEEEGMMRNKRSPTSKGPRWRELLWREDRIVEVGVEEEGGIEDLMDRIKGGGGGEGKGVRRKRRRGKEVSLVRKGWRWRELLWKGRAHRRAWKKKKGRGKVGLPAMKGNGGGSPRGEGGLMSGLGGGG